RPRSTTSDLETKRAERKRHENFDRRCERCDRPSSGRCLRANQHEVFALTQSRDSAAVLKEIGAEPVIADALDGPPRTATRPRIDPWARQAAKGRGRPLSTCNEIAYLNYVSSRVSRWGIEPVLSPWSTPAPAGSAYALEVR